MSEIEQILKFFARNFEYTLLGLAFISALINILLFNYARGWFKKNRGDLYKKISNFVEDQPVKNQNDKWLSIVKNSVFTKRNLCNKEESILFGKIQNFAKENNFLLMAQVSLGEIIGSKDRTAYRSINTKRVDFLLVDNQFIPILAIEYNGGGHHNSSSNVRDEIKEIALNSAGIKLAVFETGYKDEEIKTKLDALLGK